MLMMSAARHRVRRIRLFDLMLGTLKLRLEKVNQMLVMIKVTRVH